MRIAIVGAGAMGSLYGGVLAENGHEVIFIDPYREHMQAVRENGLTIVKEGQSRVIRGMCAVEDAEGLDPVELLIVFVKSTLTGEAVRANRHLAGKDTMVLTLQNGLGNIEQLESVVDRSQILAGTSANGASLEGPGSIRHAGWGGTTIGEPDGTHSERIRRLADILGTGELGPVTVSDNVLGLIWDKLIANVGINPLTALTRLRNGELLEHPELEDWMESLVQEAAAVAQAEGIRLSTADPAAHCRSIAQATAGNISSMLADVLRNKRTEIDSINGAVVRIGKRHGIETPANALVTALIRGLEHTTVTGKEKRMSTHPAPKEGAKKKMTVLDFKKYKDEGQKFTYVTAYDYTTASIVDESETEVILVGDSLGMIMLGYDGTTAVTMEDMVHHIRPVVKGAPNTFIVGDLPFGSYHESIEQAVHNAVRLYKETGCDCVKLEGGVEMADTIRAIVRAGIPVMGHIGLTPQTAGSLGGFKVQGGTPERARQLIEDAKTLEEAGVFSMVLECVPKGVAKALTESVSVPVLGIGAGPYVDCQVLVLQDMMDMYGDFKPKFVKHFAHVRKEMVRGLNQFHEESISGEFPSKEYCFNATVEGYEVE